MAARAYQRDGKLSGIATGLDDLDRHDGRAAGAPTWSSWPAARHGQDRARHQHRLQRRHGLARRDAAATAASITVDGGIVGFFSLEMSAEQLATRIIAEQAEHSVVPTSGAARSIRRTSTRSPTSRARWSTMPLYIDETGGLVDRAARGARAAAQAPARPRPAGHRLHPAPVRLVRQRQREPRPGGHRDHHQPEGARQGTQRPDRRAVAALAPGGEPRRQAPAALRPAQIGLDRAGRRRGDVRVSARNTT